MSMSAHEALLHTIGKIPDKQIYLPLDINSGTWAKIKSGEANFPLEKLPELFQICGNIYLLEWLANECGFDLVKKRSTAEYERDEAKHENTILKRLIKDLTRENN